MYGNEYQDYKNNKRKKGFLIGFGIVIFLGLVTLIYGVSTSNYEIDLRNQASAQNDMREAYFDKMWKTIQQQAEVSNEYKDAFAEIYPQLIEGRYSQGDGSLMKWIQEANPNFDTSLYKTLMNTIEAQREGFFNEQKKLRSIIQQHDNLLQKFPSSMFVGGRDKLDYKIISSKKTKKVMETGEENDIDLF